MSTKEHTDVDVVVIGSGAGGLTTALALARAGKKVVVLEQHDVPGGWCHSFTLEGYRFSPGVHYIGQLGEGGSFRAIYEGLGVANDMAFFELNPDGFEHILVGDERFDIPKGRHAFEERLKARFPHEARGISKYLSTVHGLARELDALTSLRLRSLPLMPFKFPTLFKTGLRSLAGVLNGCVSDPVLRTILAMQAGDHGLAPSEAPFPIHAAIQSHYFSGAYYPKGGGFTIPRAFVRGLKRHGGSIELKARVDKILFEGSGGRRRAIGVRLADGTEIRAKQVVSNADPAVTYGQMIGEDHLPRRLRRRLRKTKWSVSALSLFMATDMDLRAAGMDSGNYWVTSQPDVGAAYRVAKLADPRAIIDNLPFFFLTATTLKDPTKLRRHHTMEAFAFVSYEGFRRWAHTRYGDRPDSYEALKQDLTGAMISRLDRVAPGLSERIVWSSLGTPLTNEHYCMSTQGNIYGTEKKLRNLPPFGYGVKTPFDGLTMCGASTIGHGIMGATASGLFAARHILGGSLGDLLGATGQNLKTYASDDPSTWPEKLRRKVTLERPAANSEPALAAAQA